MDAVPLPVPGLLVVRIRYLNAFLEGSQGLRVDVDLGVDGGHAVVESIEMDAVALALHHLPVDPDQLLLNLQDFLLDLVRAVRAVLADASGSSRR